MAQISYVVGAIGATSNGPRQANLVFIPSASSEGSGEPAHPRSLAGRAGSPEPPLLAHTSSESRGTFRQKARSLAPLNGWACAVKICHDGMLEDTNSLDASPSRKLLRIKVTPDLHLTYSKNGGNLGLVLKMKNIACISILLTKHVKYTYLYLFIQYCSI